MADPKPPEPTKPGTSTGHAVTEKTPDTGTVLPPEVGGGIPDPEYDPTVVPALPAWPDPTVKAEGVTKYVSADARAAASIPQVGMVDHDLMDTYGNLFPAHTPGLILVTKHVAATPENAGSAPALAMAAAAPAPPPPPPIEPIEGLSPAAAALRQSRPPLEALKGGEAKGSHGHAKAAPAKS